MRLKKTLLEEEKSTSDLANEVEQELQRYPIKQDTDFEKNKLKERKGVSTGCTPLNLALTDDPYIGYILGTLVNIVGDSSSGKTFLLWSMFGESLINPSFNNHTLVYDEPERSFCINERLFGEKTNRINREIQSKLVHEFHHNILKEMEIGPFIWGLDSFDAVSTKEEEERIKVLLKTGKIDGSYGMEKQRYSGTLFRTIVDPLKLTDSLLVVVSQTRQKIGVTFGGGKTRSGGDALRFYSSHEIWLSIKEHIKRKDKDVGVQVLCKVKKNKLTGKCRIIEFPIYYDYGVDDISSMINWLLIEKFWKKDGQTIDTGEDFGKITEKKLIDTIEANNEKEKLVQIVANSWYQVEKELATNRPAKY